MNAGGPPTLRRLLLSLLRILSGIPIVSLLGLGLLFAAFSITWKGRCVGLSAVLLGGLLYSSVGYWNRPWFKSRRRRLLTALIPTSLILILVAAAFAPNGGNPDARVRNCFLGGRNRFHRYSPWNVIPEVDQVSVGLHLVPLGDPYVNSAKARRMRSLALPTYERMDQDPAFRELGSAMGLTCRDLLRLNFRNGHYYLFLPETAPDERIPCSFVESTAKILRRTGYDVEMKTYDGEDHYLILSQPEALLDDLAQFMTEPHAATRSNR